MAVSSAYPVLVSYVLVAMNVTLDGMNFEAAPYNIPLSDNKLKPAMNNNIRNSEMCQYPVPSLDEVSQRLINNYLKSNHLQLQYANATVDWRVLRYNEKGHFIEHRDRVRPIEGFTHFGTQIFLPPKTQLEFQGGQLVMWQKGKVSRIGSHATKWTHVIMPLGILHKVDAIKKGTRVSYVKSIYVLKTGTKDQQLKAAKTQNQTEL